MSAKEDHMLMRYWERKGKLDEYLRGETPRVDRDRWHEDWIVRPQQERRDAERNA